MGTQSRSYPTREEQASITDKRLLRGARTRETVLRRAVDVASLEGLEDVSFGRLATDIGMSKAGIQTLFRTKESLQLATIDFARDMFIEAVAGPARNSPHGVRRLRSLIDHWIVYAETPLFQGGCFRVANISYFDSKEGPVRDALFQHQREWYETIGREFRHAVDSGEIAEIDVDLAVFQVDAVLCAANTALRLGDHSAVDKVHRTLDGLLRTP
ncbi:TetR/AcrR family transcriptional regulator [Streptomyces sp. NPDC090025]|uniref:TetR/AcrR family transcriptional regulator n=1 Tax=Streptomyces sp. NPDC090025 TaxID=3365922 RepID=UPI00383241A3